MDFWLCGVLWGCCGGVDSAWQVPGKEIAIKISHIFWKSLIEYHLLKTVDLDFKFYFLSEITWFTLLYTHISLLRLLSLNVHAWNFLSEY